MNAELDDLMLEYLLRKKLGQDITKYKTQEKLAPITVIRKTMPRGIRKHQWTIEEYEKVAMFVKQGYKASQIARMMDLRTNQIVGAIGGLKGQNLRSAAPHLLVGER